MFGRVRSDILRISENYDEGLAIAVPSCPTELPVLFAPRGKDIMVYVRSDIPSDPHQQASTYIVRDPEKNLDIHNFDDLIFIDPFIVD